MSFREPTECDQIHNSMALAWKRETGSHPGTQLDRPRAFYTATGRILEFVRAWPGSETVIVCRSDSWAGARKNWNPPPFKLADATPPEGARRVFWLVTKSQIDGDMAGGGA